MKRNNLNSMRVLRIKADYDVSLEIYFEDVEDQIEFYDITISKI